MQVSTNMGMKLFHSKCFTCAFEKCSRKISLKTPFITHNSNIYCKRHENVFRTCKKCSIPFTSIETDVIVQMSSNGPFYHKSCVDCELCTNPIKNVADIRQLDGSFFCAFDHSIVAPKCEECGDSLNGQIAELNDGEMFHENCLRCFTCQKILRKVKRVGGHLVCHEHRKNVPDTKCKCFSCSKYIEKGKQLSFHGLPLHSKCFRCFSCSKWLKFAKSSKAFLFDSQILCNTCLKLYRTMKEPTNSLQYASKAQHSVYPNQHTTDLTYNNLDDESTPEQSITDSSAGSTPPIKFDRGNAIGEGRHGKVFKCRNAMDNTLMAMKEINIPEDECETEKVFEKEIEILKSLDHPNIVKLIDTQLNPFRNSVQIFMEFVPGHSLYAFLREFGPFTGNGIEHAFRQLLHGLEYLHSKNVVHRDLKSKNILVSDKGVLKLCDFGSAKRSNSDAQVSIRYEGTPLWTPPETILHGLYTKQSDIWSLGCVFIELCTAALPWAEHSFHNTFAAIYHISREQSIPCIPNSIPPLYKGIIQSCLSRDPSLRPSPSQILLLLDSNKI